MIALKLIREERIRVIFKYILRGNEYRGYTFYKVIRKRAPDVEENICE